MSTLTIRAIGEPDAIDRLIANLNGPNVRVASFKRGYPARTPGMERAYLDITVADHTETTGSAA